MSLFASSAAASFASKFTRSSKPSFVFLGMPKARSFCRERALDRFSWFKDLLKTSPSGDQYAPSKMIAELDRADLIEEDCPGFLNLAAAYANLEVLSYLLEEKRFDPDRLYRYCPISGIDSPIISDDYPQCLYWNFGDHLGEVPLLTAVRLTKNPEIIQCLLKAGANPNAPSRLSLENDHRINVFPLHFGAISESTSLVKVLLDHGAGLNLKNKAGHGPLFYACQLGDVHMMRLLLKYGANPAMVCSSGIGPLDIILQNRELLKAYEDQRPDGGYFLG
jgi:hypothetical protein